MVIDLTVEGLLHAPELARILRAEARVLTIEDDYVTAIEGEGTELRAFAGNFLYSTGANEFARRFTLGHFDLPVRNCTIALDGAVVEAGRPVEFS